MNDETFLFVMRFSRIPYSVAALSAQPSGPTPNETWTTLFMLIREVLGQNETVPSEGIFYKIKGSRIR